MAVILGQAYPDLYAAVGVHSGVPSGVAVDLMSALSAMNSGPTPSDRSPHADVQGANTQSPRSSFMATATAWYTH
jgi:poly(3-hydroxybutyrate) depolymerase